MQSRHTRATKLLSHHRFASSLGAPLVRITATVKEIFPSPGFHHFANHQHLIVEDVAVELADGMPPAMTIADPLFVAVRFGDDVGLQDPVPFEIGGRTRLQGEYIDEMDAYRTQDNPGLAVLHFTHHPAGFVEYPIDTNDAAVHYS